MIKHVVVSGWIMILLAVIGAFLGFMIYAQLVLHLHLRDQPGLLKFPQIVTAMATATNNVDIQLDGRIDAEVPFKQMLAIPLHGDYGANLDLETVVPLKFVIKYQGDVEIHAATDLVGTTELVTQKHWFLPAFPLKAHIPLDFKQPISLTVPVDTQIKLSYHGPISVRFNQTVHAPMNTVLKTHLMVNREVSTPILASFGMRLHSPEQPVPIIVQKSDLKLSLSSLILHGSTD
jgi:hypothetical protein